MIYNRLASYYDGLVKDDNATLKWVNLIENNISNKNILELACGSGEITLSLMNRGYQIDASDMSDKMIEEAKKKDGASKINFFCMDMLNFTIDGSYDGVICLCDSINYLLEERDLSHLFNDVYNHLNEDGVFIFDTHSLDRLEEFEEEFFEEGSVHGNEYAWSILSQDEYIYHNFLFYDELANVNQEQHIQRVYTPDQLEHLLSEYFTFEVYTDFDQKGIVIGEKYFYICKKRRI